MARVSNGSSQLNPYPQVQSIEACTDPSTFFSDKPVTAFAPLTATKMDVPATVTAVQSLQQTIRTEMTTIGLAGLTLHGLRRSFGSLSEWCECPVGIVAQIQGHKPSATAEKHYRVRSIDLLRGWHTKIEGWMLEQAGIEQPPENKSMHDNEL